DLPGISPASARLCLDKTLMRERFQQRIGPGAAARFHAVTSESELTRRAEQLGYPVFLQPSNVSASMWSTRNDDRDSLLASYRTICDEVPRYYEKLGQKGKQLGVVLTEFMEGM